MVLHRAPVAMGTVSRREERGWRAARAGFPCSDFRLSERKGECPARSQRAGHGSHLAVPEAAFAVTGKLKAYESPADSGNIVARHFCPTCGSALYSTNSGMPGLVMLRASALDDPEVFKPELVVYARYAPSWDLVDAELPSFQGMPPTEAMPDS